MTAALDTTLRAVADETRRGILELLELRPLRAGDIATHFSRISRPAVSRHLRVLRNAGLITETRGESKSDARELWYCAAPRPLRDIEQWVARYRQYWHRKLDDLADLAERRQ